jgi:hypothetical protein
LSGPQVCSHLCFLDGRKTKEEEEEEEVLDESMESNFYKHHLSKVLEESMESICFLEHHLLKVLEERMNSLIQGFLQEGGV